MSALTVGLRTTEGESAARDELRAVDAGDFTVSGTSGRIAVCENAESGFRCSEIDQYWSESSLDIRVNGGTSTT